MDLLKRLQTIASVAADNPPDILIILELLTTISKNLLEIEARLKELESKVG